MRTDKVVLRLTDVTDKEALQSALEKDQHTHKKVIYAIAHQNDVLTILDDFNKLELGHFFDSKDKTDTASARAIFSREVIEDLYRQVHTFKGLFLQIYFY